MKIRNAILKAADHIAANPGDFAFWSCSVPGGCGSPGCAIGWIGHFLGCAHDPTGFRDTVMALTGSRGAEGDILIYDRLAEMNGGRNWKKPESCARALRLYADRFHPATERPIAYPDWKAIAAVQTVPASAADESLRWTA